MPRIPGHYEWDDNDLTPGNKKEGGLHQNLFDDDGSLKGSARFIPADDEDAQELAIPEPIYIYVPGEAEERRRAKEQEEFNEALIQLTYWLLKVGVTKGAPYAAQVWRDKARPALSSKWNALGSRRRATRHAQAVELPSMIEAIVVETLREVAVHSEQVRNTMSSAEVRDRYLAALRARAISEELLRSVENVDIEDEQDLLELQRALTGLSPQQISHLLEGLRSSAPILGDDAVLDSVEILEAPAADGPGSPPTSK